MFIISILIILASVFSLRGTQNDVSDLFTDQSVTILYPQINLNMNIQIQFDETNVTFLVKINQPTYFSIGLGSSMSYADMWVFQIENTNTPNPFVSADDYFSYSETYPSTDVKLGGHDNIYLLGYTYNQKPISNSNPYNTVVKFTRELDTGDKYDYVISQKYEKIVVAFGPPGNYLLSFHGDNFGNVIIPFMNGASGTYTIRTNYMKVHLWINIICWGILIDIPIIIARYFKTKRWYITVHWITIVLLMVGSLFAECIMLYSSQQNFKTKIFDDIGIQSQLHLIFGVIVLILIVVQCVLGYFEKQLIFNRQKISNQIISVKKTHQILGATLYSFAKLNVLLGVFVRWGGHANTSDIILYAVYLFTIIWRVLMEIMYVKQENLTSRLLGFTSIEEQELKKGRTMSYEKKLISYIEMLDYDTISAEYRNKKWVIFNNQVIDLTNQVHPGGQFIWEECQGREISRFIYGAYGLERSTIKPYTHSIYAMKMLERQTIGSLRVIPLFSEDVQEYQTFTLSSIVKLTEYVSLFEFSRGGVTFSTNLQGIDNFGRYFLMRSHDEQISIRPYTMVLCCAAPNRKFRSILIHHCLKELGLEVHENKDKLDIHSYKHNEHYHELPLMIKRYDSPTGFSQYIHSLPLNRDVDLSGPFGTHFGISHNEKETILLVAAGTGLFPFLDLLDFLLRKTLIQLMFEKQGSYDPKLNPAQIDFVKYFQQGYKFVLILSVQNLQDLIASDIYLTLAKVQPLMKQRNFELILSISDGSTLQGIPTLKKARFDEKFFQQHLPDVRQFSRVLVCGPPIINRSVPELLMGMGIQKHQIHIL